MDLSANENTIVAIATGLTPSGIGIIRISGKDAKNIASSIFVNKNKETINIDKSHFAHYGFIYDKDQDDMIDEVILLPMYAPHSYTAEDVIEIQSHGSPVVLKKILSLVLKKGAVIAEPGEFTKRAFLNGRIDLSKAEAVSDIISSKNNYALKASFNALKGNLSNTINKYRENILSYIAYIEAGLDDPEHIDLTGYINTLKNNVLEIKNNITHILDNYDNGCLIKEGINTVILGKPNVGKSSLLNTLLNEERAIVSDIAGTTRDTIKETINLQGITLNIIDTAGIRDDISLDKIEKIGIDRAKDEATKANLIILLLDASRPLDNEDKNLITLCKTLNKKFLILINKIDTGNLSINEKDIKILLNDNNTKIINFSNKTKEGFDTLLDTIKNLFFDNSIDFNTEIFISNERQKNALINANLSLSNVLTSIENNNPEDLLTIDLNDAYTYLSQILGIEINDDVVNEIFSKFCMGK